MDDSMPVELEERISYYERAENDPGPLTSPDWMVLVATGILLPAVCLIIGWFVGWPS
ncbi:MAG TPA: hypothetical protein VFY11_08635 [Nocardioidaceae bacterium]|jgi:hypothetical protein|nr:hypothetical protein [Nocardioidaceae bacterium]